jgi:CRP-like cAMP-binding protein
LSIRQRRVRNRHDIVSDAEQSHEVHLITSGFAYRYKQLWNGSRQIMGFLIPGDFCDLRTWLLGRMDHSVSALGNCELAVIPHRHLFELVDQRPRLALSLWRETMLDAAISREWVINLGRRPADGRLAHLLCEIWYRLQGVGLARDHSYEFPVTQGELADALGLSIVHVNRTLQLLRAQGLISPQSNRITLLDWPRLQEVAEFDPAYLQVHTAA